MAGEMDIQPDLLTPGPSAVAAPPPVSFSRFDDIPGQRKLIYGKAQSAIGQMKPLSNANYRLEVADVGYEEEDDDFDPQPDDEKQFIMRRGSLHRPLKGTIKLVNTLDDSVVDEKRATIANIPHLNSRGLFIRKGVVWGMRNQLRLRPGVYSRRKANGQLESHFNVKPGTGRGFRLMLDPESGGFKMQIGQSTTKLYPLLRSLGVPDDQIKEAWGEELYNKNFQVRGGTDYADMRKVLSKIGPAGGQIDDDSLLAPALREAFERAEVDEDTTELTLGERFSNLSPERILQATGKMLRIAKGEARDDNRDSQAFQTIHSPEDLIEERLKRDQAGTMRRLLWRATKTGNLGSVPSGVLNENLNALFEKSGLGATVEDINPFEIYDMRQAISRMGEGGIASEDSVSRDARGVQASYAGIIDAGRGPESSRLGLDLRVTDAALKGSDGLLYTKVRNTKTGEIETISARDLASKVVALPGEWGGEDKRIPVIRDDGMDYATRDEVDYEIMSPNSMMSRATAMIPFPEAMKGQRLLMGSRMTQQALPLKDAEAPLVQTADTDGRSLHAIMGEHMGARMSPVEGTVLEVSPDRIKIQTPDGKVKSVGLYNNYPLARKTFLTNEPTVRPGDTVSPGMLLAKSNFTDPSGTTAIGKNLRTAWMSASGNTLEDAVVISESAAKKLMSEGMYKTDLDLEDVRSTKKSDFRAVYPDRFKKEQFDKIDDEGVIQVGQTVETGDPLILAMSDKQGRAIGALMQTPKSSVSNRAKVWDHNAPGVITDVERTRKGVRVTVKTYDPTKLADKLTTRFGAKGVVSEIRPDDQMPVDSDGQPIEVILNSFGVISRVNPAALAEALLGKVAKKRGQPYVIPGFATPGGVADFAVQEALKHGVVKMGEDGKLIDTETLTDPRDGRKLQNIFTGNSYIMKLHHTAESKLSARDQAGYTQEGFPAKGGPSGAKRIGVLDTYSLISAGASEFLKDSKLVRGQRNDDYWRAIRNGETAVAPERSLANDMFRNQLTAAGVKLRDKGTRTGLAPLLDKDVDALAQSEITSGDTFDFGSMQPIAGGLFDKAATGGADGNKFSKITLPKKIPHPLFLDPIQRILGLTGKEMTEVMAGREKLGGATGPEAIEGALSRVNIDQQMNAAKEVIRTGARSKRDAAVKKLNYLAGLKKFEIGASDLMISKLPVIPPKYRPITRSNGTEMVHDLNYLYKDLLVAKENYQQAVSEFGDAGDEYLTMVHAAQAISGVRDPVNPKSVEQGVGGILRHAIGIGKSPKYATFQRKVVGSAVDTVGRGTITADADLDMDEVSLPAAIAWTAFKPFVTRRLARAGYSATEALKHVRERTPTGLKALKDEMKERPVVYNRAPSLHKYSYVGAWGKLREQDDAIGLPYHVLKGIGGDYDGDNVNVHVPSSEGAVSDVKEKLMPSKNLYHTSTFETHLEPMQDYLAGLYLATRPRAKEKSVTFSSLDDARRAFSKGEISLGTPIRIADSDTVG